MLGVAVITSIGSPLVFREAGSEAARMGIQSGLAVAGLALIVAIVSLERDIFSGTLFANALALIVPGVLFLRETRDTLTQMSLTRREVFGAVVK